MTPTAVARAGARWALKVLIYKVDNVVYTVGAAEKKAAGAVTSRPLTQRLSNQSRAENILARNLQRRDSLNWE